MALTGVNTYTGKTTINSGTLLLNSSGTAVSSTGASGSNVTNTDVQIGGGSVQLGASNQIANTAKIGLSGGTLNLNSNSEGSAGVNGVGALTLSATSTIDFGTLGNANLIQFAGVDTHAINSGQILQIINWEGALGTPSVTDRLLFAGTDPAAFTSQYSQSDVSFNGISGYGFTGDLGGYYEIYGITAVPEPTTVLAGFLVVGTMGWNQRRRLKGLVRHKSTHAI